MRNRLERFERQTSGSVALLFASSIVLLLGITGMAVDFGREYYVRVKLQSALDAALFAGARAKAGGATNIDEVIHTAFAANWGGYGTSIPSLSYQVQSSGAITGNATVPVPATLTAALGFSSFTAEAESGVAFGVGEVEVVLALDTTGSMAGAKLDGAKAAAKDLIDKLSATTGSSSRLKMSLVPFSNYVNVGKQYRGASWLSVANDSTSTTNQCAWYAQGSWTNCRNVAETCYNDGAPYSCTQYQCDWVDSGPAAWECYDVTTSNVWNGCVGSRTYPADVSDAVSSSNPVPGVMNAVCPTSLQRLTTSGADVKAQIDAMTATGETFIQPGLLWAWRVLAPNAPFADGSANSQVKKVVVLMTDGTNTRSPSYPDHEGGDAALANNLTSETCTKMKAAGIEIYTVAFDVTDPTVNSLLSSCASGPPFYYSASTVSDLSSAFSSIGRSLIAVRMTQ